MLFPGSYVISPGETISSVIERAGGLTDLAFPEGAIFNRVVIARREAERAQAFAADIRQTYASRLLTEEQRLRSSGGPTNNAAPTSRSRQIADRSSTALSGNNELITK